MSQEFKVDFIGIGSGKCGSTWLHENLVKHPRICDRNLKELNYFSDLYEEFPFSWYASQFSSCDQDLVRGEFSVTYLSHPLAAGRIKKHFPDVKILAIVRNPVQRTYSNYLHSLRKGDISPNVPFADYIREEQNLMPARYVDHLQVWYDTFPRDQILVLILEEFSKDTAAGYRKIFSFLGIDPNFVPPAYDQRKNEARFYRHLWLENILVRSYRWLSRRGHTRLVKHITESGVGEVIRKLNATDKELPKIDKDSRGRLLDYYKTYNSRLSELLAHDLSLWTG